MITASQIAIAPLLSLLSAVAALPPPEVVQAVEAIAEAATTPARKVTLTTIRDESWTVAS
jgi:hypothetical protein